MDVTLALYLYWFLFCDVFRWSRGLTLKSWLGSIYQFPAPHICHSGDWDQAVLCVSQHEELPDLVPAGEGGNVDPIVLGAHLVPVPEHPNAGAGVGVNVTLGHLLPACPHQGHTPYCTVMIIYYLLLLREKYQCLFYRFQQNKRWS